MGLLVSIGIFSAGFLSLLIFLPLHSSSVSIPWLLLAILGRTFLHTGLFIIAHDAMHGSLIPKSRIWNDRVGCIAVWCYGFLSYRHCQHNHCQHHANPGQVGDPDFHTAQRSHPVNWYLKFISEYLPWCRLGVFLMGWSLIGLILNQVFQISLLNFGLFCILPLLLSSIQLFVFGTYLPHRDRSQSQENHHNILSVDYPVWLSFLSCYHFGYHRTHHEFPDTPWYELPSRYRYQSSIPNCQEWM